MTGWRFTIALPWRTAMIVALASTPVVAAFAAAVCFAIRSLIALIWAWAATTCAAGSQPAPTWRPCRLRSRMALNRPTLSSRGSGR
jgi:hypothetical protein